MTASDISIRQYISDTTTAAKQAAPTIANATTASKNQLLKFIAERLDQQRTAIKAANQTDVEQATLSGTSSAYLDRLTLNDDRIDAMIEGLNQVIQLDDPVGQTSASKTLPSGIEIGKMRTPIGVIAMIYESRPNVTIDAAALCLKSGNACILRGGSEAFHSNRAISICITESLKQAGFPEACVQVLTQTDRSTINYLAQSVGSVDVIIPRGGRQLIEHINQVSQIPIIKHLDGICHVFIDESADADMAVNIALNAKTRRYGVCNAMETLLIHQNCAKQLLPILANAYTDKGVELRGCPETLKYIPDAKPADETDWSTEYLAPILAIKVVANLTKAIEHIERYGSAHTDAIVSQNLQNTKQFVRQVNSSSVMINTSTAFADGFEYGLGAEIGISTDKLNIRGPVGLEGLTSQKYVVYSNGSIRA